MPLRNDIIALIESARLPLADEKILQAELARLFDGAGIVYRREVRLSAADIVDFMIADGLAIEIKIKGQRRAIYKQLERYCAHAHVGEIVLATNVAMGLPDAINGKPVGLARLGRGWL
ncbi:hypothetical protein [Bradyrhizobium sp. SZCCHNR1020]|uniref:hypothetical protein n=1 Tax=Bradyrhizobium sp. SZCCHNR1020 TaxID=3057343 RepID=UPI002915E131|nr:hypothetical protein [Bradyrhizobium sp. SZCCHNR1020]